MTASLPFSNRANALLKSYLELDTSLPDGRNYAAALQLLGDFLGKIGFTVTTIPMPESVTDGRPNRSHLIARRFESDKLPTLLIYNHIDVVPATYPEAFTLQITCKKIAI